MQIDTSLASSQNRKSSQTSSSTENLDINNPEETIESELDDDDLLYEDEDDDIEDIKLGGADKPQDKENGEPNDLNYDDEESEKENKKKQKLNFRPKIKNYSEIEGGKNIDSYMNDSEDDDQKCHNLDDVDLFDNGCGPNQSKNPYGGSTIEQDAENFSSSDEIVKEEVLYERKLAQGKSLKPRNVKRFGILRGETPKAYDPDEDDDDGIATSTRLFKFNSNKNKDGQIIRRRGRPARRSGKKLKEGGK
ncbi:UNKNOWN [Stylonychia lemnae]|uniref:Uncharacterized protein n=1 Tax=Stylonychia lemnae TaxID=5949 RepID=A0A077ZV09_STYLE|nr:UNKNOWN [Stylonychia lemnae]|eukprot:CDW73724.1 UNKNOWN [Stylonychia lemnae]